jgi:oligopeptide/dipeptide ABC transporter ATP-binding protein
MNSELSHLIDIHDLKAYFFLRQGLVKAVDGISFQIKRGKILGLVGESGCGKSVTSRTLLRIEAPAKIINGDIRYFPHNGGLHPDSKADVIHLNKLDPFGETIRNIRGNEISMIFQEPMTSFGPMHTIGNQIEEVFLLHGLCKTNQEARDLTEIALRQVGMPRPDKIINQYPHQLSGGMRQRAMIAMALACQPKLLIADEPTTALDVTTEAQILDLIKELQSTFGMAVLFITHSLAVISKMADEIIVMYLGKVVEWASVDVLFYAPKHPYTRALMRSIPRVDREPGGKLEVIQGSISDPYTRPTGCYFHPRCLNHMPGICDVIDPTEKVLEDGSMVYCHLYDEPGSINITNQKDSYER